MSQNHWGESQTKHFYELNPDKILNSVERFGIKTTGRILQLNSLENRVYEIEVEKMDDHSFVVAKFYRPGRWTKDQIKEEHAFLQELKEFEIPVIAPIEIDGETLFFDEELQIYFALFPRQMGRLVDEWNEEDAQVLGRLLGRVHNIGASKPFVHRLQLTSGNFIQANLDFMLNSKYLPEHLKSSYQHICQQLHTQCSEKLLHTENIRLHGDCHRGNVIKRYDQMYLIDFDDAISGPAIQDIWLLFPGRDEDTQRLKDTFINSYEIMRPFPFSQWRLVEVMRTLRMINYSAWIARRYDDPSFINAFPQFTSERYFAEHIQDLREQLDLIQSTTDYYDL